MPRLRTHSHVHNSLERIRQFYFTATDDQIISMLATQQGAIRACISYLQTTPQFKHGMGGPLRIAISRLEEVSFSIPQNYEPIGKEA